MSDLVRIESDGVLYALIMRNSYQPGGVNFVTEPEHSQQVAWMSHNKGTTIDPHLHNPVRRVVRNTSETLMIRSGRLRCDLYDNKQTFLQSCTLEAGDLIILFDGGHGFVALSDVQMVEIKQGPYVGSGDKTHFKPVIGRDVESN